MATVVSIINMKGGVGKTTLTFNLAWYCAWKANLRVLASEFYPSSSQDAKPIFMVDRVQAQIKEELYQVGEEFLEVIGLQ